ncbi:MAG: TusE/DsrC/DsvC family sulfur relay protein [Wenzhouxiangellaceae bacterium]|nr:TusE/DsrC/DsvC family sulfur relay protein [Wenzhouxiangellaceae bacterium]
MNDPENQRARVSGHDIDLDVDGHLRHADAWSEALAECLARQDGVVLEPLHWWVIHFVRAHQRDYGMPPLMRTIVSEMRRQTDCDDASSRTLYRLFPDGPVRMACRYAGLPRPESCI